MVLQIIDFLNRHHDYSVAALPMTYTMIQNISSYGVLLMLFLFFYAGEVVWNNRKNNFDELIDSTPHHALEMVLAQVTAVWLAILLFIFYFF